tara:strand:+ start:34707 stop:35075 length:369 start_codon:yes stop_codon:yes gene_type:complete
MNSNKIVIISLVFNALLIVVLVLFIIFGRTKPIPKYEAEIATLTTINVGLEKDNVELIKTKANDDKAIAKYDENLIKVSKELISSKAEINRLNKRRNEIPNYVNGLGNDALIGIFTNQVKRK